MGKLGKSGNLAIYLLGLSRGKYSCWSLSGVCGSLGILASNWNGSAEQSIPCLRYF
jgi:uncharacterized protein (DUF2235 family)